MSDIRLTEAQKAEKLEIHIRGGRLDLFTRTTHDIFDVEERKKKQEDLSKRPRAYHVVISYVSPSVNLCDLISSIIT